ncbi:MAG: UDP-N-acetylmuramate dehydrogenase [Clostridiales bacterium]|nr:UDP-N-acetylmuramate dehydrogenase [Clostridiales bacterium]
MPEDLNTTWGRLLSQRFLRQAPLAPLLTIRTGGPARYLLEVRDGQEAALAWVTARSLGVPVLLMGRGSNLLMPDEGFEGLVIHFGADYAHMEVAGDRLIAQAGVSLKALAYFAADRGLAGLAFAAGIPGSLGGGLIMNAGAYHGEMAQVVEAVECVDQQGRQHTLTREEARLSYRHSLMMDEGLMVLGATLRLTPGSRDALYATMAEFQALRRDKQPLAWPSAGSFFKRPPGYYAGALIEQAGLKGLSIGGAQVSEKHAGFLINTGGATTAEFLQLKDLVQQRVMARFGVALEPEVRIITNAAP